MRHFYELELGPHALRYWKRRIVESRLHLVIGLENSHSALAHLRFVIHRHRQLPRSQSQSVIQAGLATANDVGSKHPQGTIVLRDNLASSCKP